MNFDEAINSGLKKRKDFSGRASREEFWYWQLFFFLVLTVSTFLDLLILHPTHIYIFSVAVVALIRPTWAVGARRLHDTGRTGWWQLSMVTTIFIFSFLGALADKNGDISTIGTTGIGWMILITVFRFFWYCKSGDAGDNCYGPSPLINKPPAQMSPGYGVLLWVATANFILIMGVCVNILADCVRMDYIYHVSMGHLRHLVKTSNKITPAQIAQWQKGAQEGDAVAQDNLAKAYSHDWGMRETAKHWFLAAAGQGNGDAMWGVAMYTPTPQERFEWVQRSAEAGYPLAQNEMATTYLDGNPAAWINVDCEKGIAWLRRAAEGGDIGSQQLLVWDYHYGTYCIKKDDGKSLKWLQRVSVRGDLTAEYTLAQAYRVWGYGLEKDNKQAAYWFHKAADQGDFSSRWELDRLEMPEFWRIFDVLSLSPKRPYI